MGSAIINPLASVLTPHDLVILSITCLLIFWPNWWNDSLETSTIQSNHCTQNRGEKGFLY